MRRCSPGCRRSGAAGHTLAGFTLPELLAVMAILGVLGLVAMVKMTGRGRADASAGLAREVYTRLVQARFTAITGGARVMVQLWPAQHAHVLQLLPARSQGMSPGDGFVLPTESTDELSGRRDAQIVAVSDTVDVTDNPLPPIGGPASIIFYPDGTASIPDQPRSPGVTIYVADDQLLHRYRVTVLSRTGFARLVDR